MGCPPKQDDCLQPPLSACAQENTLARKLIPTANKLRGLFERFGLRPYRVLLVKTRWSGGERGRGVEEVISEKEIRPTPLVSTLTVLTSTVFALGEAEVGTLTVSEINGNLSENDLRGEEGAQPIPPDVQFFYEIEFFRPGRDSDRRRFSMRGAPSYSADEFGWTIRLERAYSDRNSHGDPG